MFLSLYQGFRRHPPVGQRRKFLKFKHLKQPNVYIFVSFSSPSEVEHLNDCKRVKRLWTQGAFQHREEPEF